LVKPRHEHEWANRICLMSKRNEAWNGIMDSMVKTYEKDMKTWFVHLKYVVRFEQLHMFEAILC